MFSYRRVSRPTMKLFSLATAVAVTMLCAMPSRALAQETPSTITPQSPALDEHYRVQPEDAISIVVRDIAESSGDFLVRKDGYITVPMVGEIKIAGLTTKEIAALLTEKLKKEIRSPEVTVNLRSSSVQRIYTMGAIRSSGVLDWKPKWRLTEVIAAAGGLSSSAERTKVLIFRPGSKHINVNLRSLLVDGDDDVNLEVMPGDVLNFQTDVSVRVQVVGDVGRPGLVEVLEGQGVVEALAAAGGGLETARLSGAKIMRKGQEMPIDLFAAVKKGNPSLNQTVKDGDTLYVPTLTAKVAVIGQVGRPGPIVVPDGETLTLTQAVTLAGGPSRQAKTDSIAVVRMGPDRKPVATKYDLKQLLRADKPLEDPLLQDGDLVVIAQSGKTGLGEISGSLGILGFLTRFFPF